MSKESASNPEFAKLDALVNEIEADLMADSSHLEESKAAISGSDSTMSEPSQTSDIVADITTDITVTVPSAHPIATASPRLNERSEDELEELTADIWQELSNQLHAEKDLLSALNVSALTAANAELRSSNSSAKDEVNIATAASSTTVNSALIDSDINVTSIQSDMSDNIPAGHTDASSALANQAGEGATIPLDEGDRKLAAIQERIDRYWEKNTPKMNPTAHALSLVLSLGFVVAAVMYGSYIVARELVTRTGQTWLTPCLLMVGAALGFYMGYILLAPFTKANQHSERKRSKAQRPIDLSSKRQNSPNAQSAEPNSPNQSSKRQNQPNEQPAEPNASSQLPERQSAPDQEVPPSNPSVSPRAR